MLWHGVGAVHMECLHPGHDCLGWFTHKIFIELRNMLSTNDFKLWGLEWLWIWNLEGTCTCSLVFASREVHVSLCIHLCVCLCVCVVHYYMVGFCCVRQVFQTAPSAQGQSIPVGKQWQWDRDYCSSGTEKEQNWRFWWWWLGEVQLVSVCVCVQLMSYM